MYGKPASSIPQLDYWIRSSDQETIESEGMTPRGQQILEEFNRIYEITGVLKRATRILAPRIRELHEKVRRPVRLLDIGMRDGTLLRLFEIFGAKENIPLELHGVEFRPDIAAVARTRCAKQESHIQVHCDPGKDFSSFPPECFDVVCSTFMLHHQDPLEIQQIIAASMRLSRFSVFHLDLVRSLWSIVATWSTFTALGLRESRTDAVLSCRRAFRKKELKGIIETLKGESEARVRSAFPMYLLIECNFRSKTI